MRDQMVMREQQMMMDRQMAMNMQMQAENRALRAEMGGGPTTTTAVVNGVPMGNGINQPLNPVGNMNTPYAYGQPVAPVYGQPMGTGGSYYYNNGAMNADPYYPTAAMDMMILTEEQILMQQRRRNGIIGVIVVLILVSVFFSVFWLY